MLGEGPGERGGGFGGRPARAVRVQRQPDDDPPRLLALRQPGDLVEVVPQAARTDEGGQRVGAPPQIVAGGEADAPGSVIH